MSVCMYTYIRNIPKPRRCFAKMDVAIEMSGADQGRGLTEAEVILLREKWGYNEVTPKVYPEWRKVLSRFLGIIPIIMLTTATLSAAVTDQEGLRDWLSFAMLLFELFLVVTVDYYSDRNAGNAIKAVKALSAPVCKCKRDGEWKSTPVREVLPGDVCALVGGAVVPADGRLIGQGEPILIDESSLTGEALVVTRRVGDEILGGAVVQSGELEMMVTSIGENTFFGKTLSLLGTVQGQGHLKKVLQWVAKIMATVGALGCIVLLFVKIFRDGNDVAEAVKFAFVLLSSVVPIAMPVVTTTVLSVGALELSKESAAVTRLSAIEELAGIKVLCCDKTGTLTLNKLTLDPAEVVALEGHTTDEVILMASLASRHENQEPIDVAVTSALAEPERLKDYLVTKFVPFNPVDKRTEASVIFPDKKKKKITKGAPHIIRDLAAESDYNVMGFADNVITTQAEKGLRSLGVAVADGESEEWELIGIIALFDPPREDTASTIKEALEFGVDVKMITGDQRAIAIETASRLGMGANIVGNEAWSADPHLFAPAGGLGEYILSVNGFAGVYPEHKFKIVETLQNMGQLVGMTGDGVNDAPALKKANVGIAVAGATDAAKGAADIVLLKPGLSTIINALFVSRIIFNRLKNYITYRMASSIIILMFYFCSVTIVGTNMPTWALILLSIINDLTIMSTSNDNVIPSRTPEIWNMVKITSIASVVGFVGTGECVLFLFVTREEGPIWTGVGLEPLTEPQTNAALYLLLAIVIQLNILATRTTGLFCKFDKTRTRAPSLLVSISVFASLLLSTLLATLWPVDWRLGGGASMAGISWGHAGVIWTYAILWFFVVDFCKLLFLRLFYSSSQTDVLFNPLGDGTDDTLRTSAQIEKEIVQLRKDAHKEVLARDGLKALVGRDELRHRGSVAKSEMTAMRMQSMEGDKIGRFERQLQALLQAVSELEEWKAAHTKACATIKEE